MAHEVFFISFKEPNADANWDLLKSEIPWAKRVDGIYGVSNAHARCAQLATTRHFWTIDADNEIIPEVATPTIMDYNFEQADWADRAINVFYAKNPVNGLEYGWGGIKLWPKRLFDGVKRDFIDFTTSFNGICVVPKTLSITRFNTSPFDTWRSAFREVVKLSSIFQNEESKKRIQAWRNVEDPNEPFAEWATLGASDGIKWVKENTDLKLLNDWQQLEIYFKSKYQ